MAVKSIKIGKTNLTFVFRHKFEKNLTSLDIIQHGRNEYKIGLWYKNYKIVGKKSFKNPKKWSENLVTEHMIGCDLILCKFWVTVDNNGMKLEIDI